MAKSYKNISVKQKMVASQIESLKQLYSFNNAEEVTGFLEINSAFADFLQKAFPKLKKAFPKARFSVEIDTDIPDEYEKALVVSVWVEEATDEIIIKYNELKSGWWSKADKALDRRIALALEYPGKKYRNLYDAIIELAGTVEAPKDWSVEHDHYLYGTPKRGLLNNE